MDLDDCHGDEWAEMGKKNLDIHNVNWGDRIGFLILQKAVMNDYWTDQKKNVDWPAWKVDMVMSKLYYCWVKLLEDDRNRRGLE